MLDPAKIDWADPKAKVGKYFTVKEALWLNQWQTMHLPSPEEQLAIVQTAAKMDAIREIIGSAINVHCWIRPGKLNNPASLNHGGDYNRLVRGAPRSAHKLGLAVDWSCKGRSCDEIRALLLPHLPVLKVRMENLPRSGWVHIDLYPPFDGKNYFFKP